MRGFITDPDAPGGLRLAEDLPEPEPSGDELIVEVRAYGINRGETYLLQQRPQGWRPGQDVSGVVVREATGGNGPSEGTRVVGIVDGAGWSERVGAPLERVATLPDSVSFEQAASLPIAGLTALRALRTGGPLLGRRVLITGATGAVGQFAVQLAVAAGAHVTAQVSGPEREEQARALGAHEVAVTLDDEGLGPFDLALDGVGGEVLRQAHSALAVAFYYIVQLLWIAGRDNRASAAAEHLFCDLASKTRGAAGYEPDLYLIYLALVSYSRLTHDPPPMHRRLYPVCLAAGTLARRR